MNTAFHRLRICIATIGLVVASEAHAQCADCLTVTVNSNVNVTNLHPKVKWLQLICDGTGATSLGRSDKMPVVNRGFVGLATATLSVSAAFIASRAGHTIGVSCHLSLSSTIGDDKMAVATGGQPQNITDSNWNGVATGSWNSTAGSQIQWDQIVTFPNASAP